MAKRGASRFIFIWHLLFVGTAAGGTQPHMRPRPAELRAALFLTGFFEGFGHGLMGKSGFGYSKIALGGFAAFGRNFAREGEAAGLQVLIIGDEGGGVVRVDAHVGGSGDGVLVGSEEQKPLNCSPRWRHWSWSSWSRNGRG